MLYMHGLIHSNVVPSPLETSYLQKACVFASGPRSDDVIQGAEGGRGAARGMAGEDDAGAPAGPPPHCEGSGRGPVPPLGPEAGGRHAVDALNCVDGAVDAADSDAGPNGAEAVEGDAFPALALEAGPLCERSVKITFPYVSEPPDGPSRRIYCEDAVKWLHARPGPWAAGTSVITSMPDVSEVGMRLPAWTDWFMDTAALLLSRVHPDQVAIFYQVRRWAWRRDGGWQCLLVLRG